MSRSLLLPLSFFRHSRSLQTPLAVRSRAKLGSTMVVNEPKQSDSVSPSSADAASKPPVVCVFCGASPGTSPAHLAAARELAQAFHRSGIKLVYGGGTVGVMGELAKTLVSLSGKDAVHGVIPAALLKFERHYTEGAEADPQKIVDEETYGRTTVVQDMHSRKQMMAREVIESGEGGGFVALSGGYGTLEELMEVVTWNQLGIHARPVVVYNVEGYYDGLLQWVTKAVQSGFISENNSSIMVEGRTGEAVVEQLKNYQTAEGRFKLQWGAK